MQARHPLAPDALAKIREWYEMRVEAVQSVDRMIGAIAHSVQVAGQAENTVFVFSSDNGYHLGQYTLEYGKQTAFDTDIRVPLVVDGPGVARGSTIDAMTSSIDLAPTLLNIAGVQPTAAQDGVSLLGLLHGRPAPPDWQRAVLIEHHGPVVSPSDPDFQRWRSGDPPSYEAIRTPTYLYVEYVHGQREYYDLVRDPYELHNIAGTLSARRLATLHARLQALAHCHGAAQCQRAASLRQPQPATGRG
jgi:arylsulfatase A-like enzyme